MAVLTGNQFLSSIRINRIVNVLINEIEQSYPLIFEARTPSVTADDDDIIGRFTGRVHAADIIADDQEAPVVEGMKLEFWTNTIPNIKQGQRIGQNMINRLERIKRGGQLKGDVDWMTNWEMAMALRLIQAVRQRKNQLIISMQTDALAYNRLGLQVNGTWGMPSALKVTVSPLWSTDGTTANSANALPITNILTMLQQTAPETYGEEYNRLTMSRANFRFMVASTEFQNKLLGQLRFPGATTALNTFALGDMRKFAVDILGAEIELYEGVYYTREANGTETKNRMLPANQIIFSNSMDDNDASAMDWANGVVTESIVGSLTGAEGFGGPQEGPIAYYTAPSSLNPPAILCWAVMRGFPRKHRYTATAVMTTY